MKYRLMALMVAGSLGVFITLGASAESGVTAADNNTTHSSDIQLATQKTIGNQMPSSDAYTGLSRKVLQYSEGFVQVVNKIKQENFSEADWEPLEKLVDTKNFERLGVFLTDKAEVLSWQQYKKYISLYGAATSWEGTLRRITEVPGLVILELEERNTMNGKTDVSNTVTIYKFNEADKLVHLDVYVMPLP